MSRPAGRLLVLRSQFVISFLSWYNKFKGRDILWILNDGRYGYKLEHITVEGKIGEQIPSNYTAEGKVIIIKEKAIQTDQLKLTYNLMDYNEEWREAIWQLLSGEFDAEEYTAKFNPRPVVFDIELK